MATGTSETVVCRLALEPGEETAVQIEFEGQTGSHLAVGVVERVDEQDAGGNVYVYDGLLPTPTSGQGEPPQRCCPLPAAMILPVGAGVAVSRRRLLARP